MTDELDAARWRHPSRNPGKPALPAKPGEVPTVTRSRRELMTDLRRVNRQLAVYQAEPEITLEQAEERGIDELRALVDESWRRLDQLIDAR